MSSEYTNNACIRCSIKQIKCDNEKNCCNNCHKAGNDCHRNKAIKKIIKDKLKLNKLYKNYYNRFEELQALQTQNTEQAMLKLSLEVEALRQQILQNQLIINEQRMSNPLLDYYFNNLGFNNNQDSRVEALHQQILYAINEQRMTNPLLNHYPNEFSFGNNNQVETLFHQQTLQTVNTTSEQEMSNPSLNFKNLYI
nr:11613_t:CDS:2 [Entrophospora candida]